MARAARPHRRTGGVFDKHGVIVDLIKPSAGGFEVGCCQKTTRKKKKERGRGRGRGIRGREREWEWRRGRERERARG